LKALLENDSRLQLGAHAWGTRPSGRSNMTKSIIVGWLMRPTESRWSGLKSALLRNGRFRQNTSRAGRRLLYR